MSTLYDPAAQARDAGAAVVDDPIINPPYDEPQYYWDTVDWETKAQKTPQKVEGRRPAGYFYNRTGPKAEGSLLEEEFVALDCVNEIRNRVREWRRGGYRYVSPATRDLLHHWSDPGHELRLFFCQREAAETVIWLTETPPSERAGLFTQSVDGEQVELDAAHEPFTRYCCKMATGTGKTVVMAMLIAWQTINKALYPQDTRFTNAFLIVGPGLTVAERLQVVRPSHPDNYYDKFDLVPTSLRGLLGQARICILHRQAMAARTDTGKRGVVRLGPESDSAFANRLLKRELGSANRIFVINDEGHHCYRPRVKRGVADADGKPTKEERAENERAAQWLDGLERIGRVRAIYRCLDFSATPYYIHGSGYPTGRPFPWIVSDFGLLDAIESGLVKIPQLPVDDNHGDGKRPPAYFHLWRWVNDQLPPEDRYKPTRRGNAHSIAIKAEPAIKTMIGNWKRLFDDWQSKGSQVPPCMIIVCQDTHISEEVFNITTREEFEWDHFANKPGRPQVSYLFDSKALKDLNRAEEGENAKEMEKRLREILNTVGKEGKPGEQVRFVCSVSMLTEGWDANNVTQIVGLRAFTSQLLCEQVVGRALRRRSYDVDPETGLLKPEYADIYGVPFQVIPVKASKAGGGGKPPVTTLVRALPEREHLKITFPRVEGYVHEVRQHVRCAWDELHAIEVGASGEPTITTVGAVAGVHVGRPAGAISPGRADTRAPYYQVVRLQATLYSVAARLLEEYLGNQGATMQREQLFPQFLAIVRRYMREFVVFKEAPREEIALLKWQQRLIDVLSGHIYPVDEHGKERILPRIERSRGTGSTREVFFHTGRPCYATTKSHISHVVLDSVLWEKVAAQHLEACELVQTYARNDHLDFTIPYLDFTTGQSRNHRPDFIVVLVNGLHVALEIKGEHREVDDAKVSAGKKWAKAVNNHGAFGRWVYHICHDPDKLTQQLTALSSGA